MVLNLNDFIHVYEDAIESQYCEKLVEYFEENKDSHERINQNKVPNFTQLNLTQHSKDNKEIDNLHSYLIARTFNYRDQYYEFVDSRCFPKQHHFEEFRIKKYIANTEDQFDTHVDVTDYASARRYLSFLWYLNDVEDGGETVFLDMTIKPKCGSLVIFPPLWVFPHRGCVAKSNDKYILSTYLHYR